MSAETTMPVPPRVWGSRLATTALILAVLLWLAPILASWTPLAPWLIGRITSDFGGTVRIGSASLGWFSPIVLHGVEFRHNDSSEHPLVRVFRVQSQRSLLMSLVHYDDFAFRLEQPTLYVTVYQRTSNLDGFLTQTRAGMNGLSEPSQRVRMFPRCRLEIVDGAIQWHDFVLDHTWHAKRIRATINFAGGEDGGAEAEIQAVTHDGSESGMLNASVRLERRSGVKTAISVKGRCTALPLGVLNLVVRPRAPDVHLLGSVQGNGALTATIDDEAPCVQLSGDWLINHCGIATPWCPTGIYIERIAGPCHVRLDRHTLIVDRAAFQSEVANVRLQGRWDFDADWRTALASSELDLVADINVAALAERCPTSIPLHEDMVMSSGQLFVQCKIEKSEGSTALHARLRSTEMRGYRGDVRIEWPDAMTIECEIHDLQKGWPRFERLKCTSDFLRINASQLDDTLTADVSVDVQRIIEPLSQFIDLDGLKVEGKFAGAIQIRQIAERDFHVKANADFKGFAFLGATGRPWREDTGAFKLEAVGPLIPSGDNPLRSADLNLLLNGDRLAVKWAPAADHAEGALGTATLQADGDLARWQNRLRAWTCALDDWRFFGACNAKTTLHVSTNSLAFESADVLAINVRCQGPNVHLHQPALTVTTGGTYDFSTGILELTQTELSSPGVQGNAERLRINLERQELSGAATMVLHLDRMPAPTRETAAKFLAYAVPPFASATDYCGAVLVNFQRIQMPMADASSAEIDGTMALKELTFTPGPMLRELALHLSKPAAACAVKDGSAAFRVADENVHHANFLAAWGEGFLRSTGTVGFDGSMALVFEVGSRTDAAQPRRIEIGGALGRPVIDRRAKSITHIADSPAPVRPRGVLGAPLIPKMP